MGEEMIFIDTSAFYAMEVQTDVNHVKASEVKAEIAENKYGAPLTTNYIIDEVVTLLRFKAGHKEAVEFGNKIRSSKSLRVVRVDETLEDIAWKIFKKHREKDLSFTDCTSFGAMRELKISLAFAFDQHFAQMGFKVVPI